MITVVINGENYQYPEVGDAEWGDIATRAFDAITKTTLQPVKDLNDPSVVNDFTLYNDIDFGTTHGLRVLFIQSRSNNPAASGVFRLAKDELVAWRNEDNDGDNTISFDSDGDLIVNGVKVTLHGQIVNDDIAAGAGIEESKLALDYSTDSLHTDIDNHINDTNNPHATSFSNLSGVNVSYPGNGETLVYDSNDSEWKNKTLDLQDLGDVSAPAPYNEDVLVYDDVSNNWKPSGIVFSHINNSNNPHFTTIDNLDNTAITTPSDGDSLQYDSNDQVWKNTSTLSSHVSNTSNPHSVTKSQILTGDLIVNADVDASAAIAESKLALDHSTDSLNTAITSHTGNTSNPHSTTVANLTDTTITSATNGDVLSYDGSKWVNIPSTSSSLSGLSDTDITTPANGDTLVYDSVAAKWENSDQLSTLDSTVSTHVANTSNPHSTSVSNLDDASISSVADGDVLVYDSVSTKWENSDQLSTLDTTVSSHVGNTSNPHSTTVSNLDDASISSVVDGDILVYDSNDSEWKNSDALSTLDTTVSSHVGNTSNPHSTTVSNLTDTTITSVSDKDTLVYDGNSSKWINAENSIDNLSNVDIDSNTETENDVLVYDDVNQKWINSQILVNHIGNAANPHLTTVAKLTDASITTPANKELLQYDYANSQWINSSDVWTQIEVNDIANINSANMAVTLTASDKKHQIFTATNGFDISLPSTNVKAGDTYVLEWSENWWSTFTTPFKITDASNPIYIWNSFTKYYLTAKVNNPSSLSDWYIHRAIKPASFGGGTTDNNVSIAANGAVDSITGTILTLPKGTWNIDFHVFFAFSPSYFLAANAFQVWETGVGETVPSLAGENNSLTYAAGMPFGQSAGNLNSPINKSTVTTLSKKKVSTLACRYYLRSTTAVTFDFTARMEASFISPYEGSTDV